MDSDWSYASSGISWGPWTQLPNGQWHRKGSDSSGNEYEENREEDPRGPRHYDVYHQIPSPSIDDFALGLSGLSLQSNYYNDTYEEPNLNYGGDHQGKPGGLDPVLSESKTNHSRTSRGDTNGSSMSSRRTNKKRKDRGVEQQTTSDPYQDQGDAAKNIVPPSSTHMTGRQLAVIDEEIRESSMSEEIHGPASNKQDLQGELDPSLSVSFIEASSDHATTRRQLIIQNLINDVEAILQTRTQSQNAVIRGHTPSSSDPDRNNISSRPDKEINPPDASIRQSGLQNKRKLSTLSDGEDNEDEEQTHGKIPKGKEKEVPEFACPYVKYDTLRYGPRPCCNRHGWRNVFRIKEHLYRKHRQATHCPRCHATFDSVSLLTHHQRAQPPCNLSRETTVEGFNEAQKDQLKSRRDLKGKSEREKWRKMYIILFPGVGEDQILSPYYNPEDSHGYPVGATWAELEARMRLKLPNQIANDLERVMNPTGLGIDNSLLVQLVTEAVEKFLTAENAQRAGVFSKVTSPDPFGQTDEQTEASSSTSATNMDSFTHKDYSQALHLSNSPRTHDVQEIDSSLNNSTEGSYRQSRGPTEPKNDGYHPPQYNSLSDWSNPSPDNANDMQNANEFPEVNPQGSQPQSSEQAEASVSASGFTFDMEFNQFLEESMFPSWDRPYE